MGAALDELASLFHRIAVAQTVPQAADSLADADAVARYAIAFTPEATQLAYQICLQGRADLPLAPDESTGFAMTLLRLLAFEPAASGEARPVPAAPRSIPSAKSPPGAATAGPASAARATPSGAVAGSTMPPEAGPPGRDGPPHGAAIAPAAALDIPDWPSFVAGLKLSGIALQLAAQTELKAIAGSELVLLLPEASRHLADKAYADKLKGALDAALGRRVRLRFEFGDAASETLAVQAKRQRAQAQATTEAAFRDDPFVQDVLQRFGGTVKPDSIKPVE